MKKEREKVRERKGQKHMQEKCLTHRKREVKHNIENGKRSPAHLLLTRFRILTEVGVHHGLVGGDPLVGIHH